MRSRRRILSWAAIPVVVGIAAGAWQHKWSSSGPAAATRQASPFPDDFFSAATNATGDDAVLGGVVRESSGEPIAGARVCATCSGCFATSTERHTCLDSDDRGRFRFDGLEAMAYKVSATAQGTSIGRARDGRPIALAPGQRVEDLEIVLVRDGVELSGIVLDALGGPIGGAAVRVIRLGASPTTFSVETGDDGTFQAWVEAGGLSVQASAEGYGSAQVYRVAPSRNVELVLTPAGRIRGRVVVVGSEEPVSGARVRATGAGIGSGVLQLPATSSSDGSFLIDGLSPARYQVSAEGEGYRGVSPSFVDIALGETVQDVVVEVKPAPQVSGRVLSGGGETPCGEGRVMLGPGRRIRGRDGEASDRPLRNPSSTLIAPISADGTVHFPAVEPADYAVTIDCVGHMLDEGSTTLAVFDEDIEGERWRVQPGAWIDVLTVDERGEPVPGAKVRMFLSPPPGQPGAQRVASITTDPDGRHRVPQAMAPGTYGFEPDGGYNGERVELVIEEGMTTAEAVVQIAGAGSVTVAAVSAEGLPLDGLTVLAKRTDREEASQAQEDPPGAQPGPGSPPPPSGPSGATGNPLGEGRYHLGPLEAGSYQIEVHDERNPPLEAGEVVIAAGSAEELEVVLEREQTIEGRVVDEKGAPAADVWITVEASDALITPRTLLRRRIEASGRVLTDSDGQFVVRGLAPQAHFDVTAEEQGGGLASASDVEAGSRLELALDPPARLSGVAVDADGEAVDEVTLRVVHESGTSTSQRFTADHGRFAIQDVPAGKLKISAWDRQGRSGHAEATLEPGEVRDGLRIVLSSAQALLPPLPSQ